MIVLISPFLILFFFKDTATTEIYTLSLHDALPISRQTLRVLVGRGVLFDHLHSPWRRGIQMVEENASTKDRKSTRLNSSHPSISYAVFCLKKKKKHNQAVH